MSELEQLLKEDDLSVPNEKAVLEALISWVSFWLYLIENLSIIKDYFL